MLFGLMFDNDVQDHEAQEQCAYWAEQMMDNPNLCVQAIQDEAAPPLVRDVAMLIYQVNHAVAMQFRAVN